jgi:hypothetical protein
LGYDEFTCIICLSPAKNGAGKNNYSGVLLRGFARANNQRSIIHPRAWLAFPMFTSQKQSRIVNRIQTHSDAHANTGTESERTIKRGSTRSFSSCFTASLALLISKVSAQNKIHGV